MKYLIVSLFDSTLFFFQYYSYHIQTNHYFIIFVKNFHISNNMMNMLSIQKVLFFLFQLIQILFIIFIISFFMISIIFNNSKNLSNYTFHPQIKTTFCITMLIMNHMFFFNPVSSFH